MSLLVLVYHRARLGMRGNSPQTLDRHFAYIARHFANVLPGEPLGQDRHNVCLTFDDGYFDFYETIFPLLRKHGLRAVLAIPPAVIREAALELAGARLGHDEGRTLTRTEPGAFCTWTELGELADTGAVSIAAHGYTHRRVDQGGINLEMEVDAPQTILSSRLEQPVQSYVFPHGRCSRKSVEHARKRYPFLFRNGGALNRDWNGRVIYRIPADRTPRVESLFSSLAILKYRLRYYWNQLGLG